MGSNDNNAIHKETVKFSILYLLFQFVFPFFLAGILLIVFIPLNDNVINSYYSWIKVEEEFAFLTVAYFFEIIIFTIMSFVFGYKIKCILKNVNEKRIIFISVILSSLVILCNYYSKELLLFNIVFYNFSANNIYCRNFNVEKEYKNKKILYWNVSWCNGYIFHHFIILYKRT